MEFITKRTFEKGALVFTVGTVYDPTPCLDHLRQEYASESPEDRDKYLKQDAGRVLAFESDEWHMLGIVCEIAIKTAHNWAVLHVVGRSSIWNVESDSGADYFKQMEDEQIAEAEYDMKLTANALALECAA